MTSAEIRQSFLDFFREKQHTVVPSSSLLPDSPNLLFTNAGMNQFVPIFLGQTACPYSPRRAADTQKCIRAGGKHNDLDDVGLDTYHHTFFEMLGNWSFGDYFKKEAIEWAWELVVERWNFPAARLYATIYQPDKSAGDPAERDEEAWSFWAEKFRAAGLDPAVHIVNGNKRDNFWMMGETGPCGPCSELHVDLTPLGDTRGALVNRGDARCIEIWNLVFIQFNAQPAAVSATADPAGRKGGIEFAPLAQQHVDTGMGFERVASIIQGTKGFTDFAAARISNYETDIFRPIFDELERMSGRKYESTLPAMGSTGNLPVPLGDPPSGTGHAPATKETAPHLDTLSHSAGPVAQQHGQVARATHENRPAPGATYAKRNLPHFEKPWAIYHAVFHTIPARKLSPAARDLVFDCVLHWRESRYRLVAACVMPDHVHFIFQPGIKEDDAAGNAVFWPLTEIFHSIKSYSAKEINKLDRVSGTLWQDERYDRYIRSDADLEEKFSYVCRNPWTAGLVEDSEPWPWLWHPEIEAWKPYVPLEKRAPQMGGTGDPPVPLGDPPSGTENAPLCQDKADRQIGAPPRSAGPVAQQHGQVARATQDHAVADLLPVDGTTQEQIDIAFRVIADHIRTLSFAIADGIQPGNTDRNYVLRRILRRAVRYGRTLGFHEPFFYKLVAVLAREMSPVFPELREKQKQIEETLRREEEAFNKTLDRGIALFEDVVSLRAGSPRGHDSTLAGVFGVVGHGDERTAAALLNGSIVSGDFAFKLYDTYGFPLDLTELMARERGLTVDVAGFEVEMEKQRARARAAQKKTVIALSEIETTVPTRFVGYDALSTEATVLEVVVVKDRTAVILDASAAYAEMGGQVGDTGEIAGGGQLWNVLTTQKSGGTWLHFIEPVMGEEAPAVGATVTLSVDEKRRRAIERHHTVTHLLHWALHSVVSKEATQKGSFVGSEKLTFDFNSQALTPSQVRDIERLVNERIVENAGVSWTEVPYAEVKGSAEVMQFFGDKYGETVRVVQIGGTARALDGFSMELCAGTHTRATGEIGLFRINTEAAIASGVRRIEAQAGLNAYELATEDSQRLHALAMKLGAPLPELEKRIEAMLAQQKELEKALKAASQREAAGRAKGLLEEVETFGGVPAIISNLGALDGDALQTVADALKAHGFKGVVLLGGSANGAVALVATVSPEFTAKAQAGKIIGAIAPMVGGKGGGKPEGARGGGKDPAQLDAALAKAKALLA